MSFTIASTIYPSSIEYSGYGVDDTRASIASASSGASADAGASVSGLTSSYPGGYGSGWATTYTGSGASNSWDNATVSQDWTDWWYPYPYDYNVGYEGYLAFTASITPFYQGEPTGDMFTVSATVGGSAAAQASIQIGDPNYYYLRAGGEGAYSITGQAEITLYGDIQ